MAFKYLVVVFVVTVSIQGIAMPCSVVSSNTVIRLHHPVYEKERSAFEFSIFRFAPERTDIETRSLLAGVSSEEETETAVVIKTTADNWEFGSAL